MPGRKRAEIQGEGNRAELARRLRALRDRREMTLRQLAAKSGYSQATLSGAEAGRESPSWPVTAAFVQSCGEDPRHWRQLWELAAASSPAPTAEAADHDEASGPLGIPDSAPRTEPHADESADTPAARRFPRRVRLAAAAVLACTAALGVSAAFMSGAHGTPHADTTAPPDSAPVFASPTATPSSQYQVRRFDTTIMNAGERITLDAPPGVPWPRATSGWVGYDLEFTLSQRQLVSVGTQTVGSSLAYIARPTGTYLDCSQEHDYSGVVPTDAIVPGTEFCVITNQRRRALIVIRAVHHDAAGRPDQVTLTIATWNHIIDPGA